MSRARVSVATLARECDVPVDDVIARLCEGGLDVSAGTDVVPRSKAALARRVLGLQRPRGRPREKGRSQDLVSAPVAKGDLSELRVPTVVAEPRRARVRTQAKLRDAEFRWRIVGKAEPIHPLAPGEIEAIHWQIVDDFGRDRDPIEPPGVKDAGLLESAAHRPLTSLGGIPKYPTVAMAGAAVFHGIVHNHPFHNGNKRTALVSLIAFLDRHGYVVNANDDELFEYVLLLAKHEVVSGFDEKDPHRSDKEMLEAARWLQGRLRKVRRDERIIPFRKLRGILTRYGCEFEVRSGNRINIVRDSLKTQTFYSGEGMEVELNSIHRIRKELLLDEGHGIDSYEFYGTQERIPTFIAKYRGILERLAAFDRTEEQERRAAPR